MAVRVSPCWQCHRTASPCHSPPSSQVSAGKLLESAQQLHTAVCLCFFERKLVVPFQTEIFQAKHDNLNYKNGHNVNFWPLERPAIDR